MKTTKLVLPLLVALAFAPAQVLAGTATVLGPELSSLTIYSNTYTSVGATTSTVGLHSDVYGSILAGGVTTMGSNSKVWGNIATPEAMNVGANFAQVTGDIKSGGVLTLGDRAIADKNITSSGAATIGDHATVAGNLISGGVLSTGDTSKVMGYVASGDTASVGANAKVAGNVSAVGLIAVSASATTGNRIALAAAPMDAANYKAVLVAHVAADSLLVSAAQAALNSMTAASASGFGLNFYGSPTASVLLAPTMTVDTTLASGVYNAASWSTTAGTKLTLDGHGVTNAAWVFNITDILAFGGTTTMEFVNAPGTPSVIWNTFNGYTTSGDGSHVIGTILAKTYVMVGANATVGSGNNATTCGGIYSAKSYVTTGDSAVVDGRGCVAASTPAETAAVVPEPGSLAMLLTGLGLLGFMLRRKTQA